MCIGVRNLYPTDKRECRDIFTVVENLGELVLERDDIRLEIVIVPLFDAKEVVVILFGLPVGDDLVRNTLVISLKLWSECRGREKNQSEATPFMLDKKVRKMSASLQE